MATTMVLKEEGIYLERFIILRRLSAYFSCWGLAYRFGKPWLDAKIGVEHSTFIFNWAETLVRAAEQMMGPGGGGAKYTYVSGALEALAESKNIKLDNDSLEAAIEAAVHQLKSEQTSAPAAVGNVVVAAPEAAIETNGGSIQ
jgi:hypothetical protein